MDGSKCVAIFYDLDLDEISITYKYICEQMR